MVTGSSEPLMLTISGSPSAATPSTSRAVDALSITPPGGAPGPFGYPGAGGSGSGNGGLLGMIKRVLRGLL